MDKKRLIEDNMTLVYHVLHKHYPTFVANEDVVQEGYLGLCNAARLWDETKSKFSTYAYQSILNQVRLYFKREMKQVDTLSLDIDVKHDDGGQSTVHDIIPDMYSSSMYDISDFDVFSESLTNKEQEVLALLKEGNTQNQIAEKTGVSQQAVNQVVRRIKRKWRNAHGEN